MLIYKIYNITQATLVACRRSLHKRNGVLEITHEMLERLEAHLTATGEIMVNQFCSLNWVITQLMAYLLYFTLPYKVTANMRGNSAEEVAERVLSQTSLCGLQVSLKVSKVVFYLFIY